MKTLLLFLMLLSPMASLQAVSLQQPAEKATASGALQTRSGTDTGSLEENVPYTTDQNPALRLDIYKPTPGGEARPAVILIHGGAWMSFDKSTMHGMGEFLSRSGYIAFSVDYRLFDGTQNRWPAQFDDVQRAVRWIRANAAKYGVNPARIGAFGHSAGAQLAALLGMEDTRYNSDPALRKYSSRVQAVVDVSGLTDFTTDQDPGSLEFLSSFLGTDFAKHPDIWRNASPAYHVAKDNAPFLIVHGSRDENVPIAQAEELYQKLKAAGVPVSFDKVDDEHTFRNPDVRRRLAIETRDFFDQYLQPAP